MTRPMEEGILSWSFKEYPARKNYKCENCGGTITKGLPYIRHVVRMGSRKGKDPLKNVHVHLDCTAPWFHPDMDERFRNLRQLPGRVPPKDKQDPKLMSIPLAVSFKTALGRITLQIDDNLAARMLHAPKEKALKGSLAEIENGLALAAFAINKASGNRRLGLKISHAFNGLMLATEYEPESTNRELDPTQILDEE